MACGENPALESCVCLVPVALQSANALTYDELQGLTYLQVKGSGIANTCPVLESGSTNLKVGTSRTFPIWPLSRPAHSARVSLAP